MLQHVVIVCVDINVHDEHLLSSRMISELTHVLHDNIVQHELVVVVLVTELYQQINVAVHQHDDQDEEAEEMKSMNVARENIYKLIVQHVVLVRVDISVQDEHLVKRHMISESTHVLHENIVQHELAVVVLVTEIYQQINVPVRRYEVIVVNEIILMEQLHRQQPHQVI